MKYLEKIVDIFNQEESEFLNINSDESIKTIALYILYNYYNADFTKISDVENSFCFSNLEFGEIYAICKSDFDDECIDFITTLPNNIMTGALRNINFINIFDNYLNLISKNVIDIVFNNINQNNAKAINRYHEIVSDINDNEVFDNLTFNIKVIGNYSIDIKDKIVYQNMADKENQFDNRIRINVIFEDDLIELVNDIDSPKNFVEFGNFTLANNSIAYFGKEQSLLGFISAKSLKRNYYLYSTKGLFASNLRYYVKQAKIDSKIVETITNDSDNFCYYNNGIIITCEDYRIKDDQLLLKNFSIVNGGQTTNLIGKTNFDYDFPIMCKVIKNKYDDIALNTEFLAKVAEASNTQKPIKAKDLIANRKEQRLLKMQFEEGNMFLQVKRGDKISKTIYPEAWQNATNDNVAQIIYSCIYQSPGAAKNAKSKLLENEKTYDKIFKNNYSTKLFISLQHLKVAFNNWVKKLKKDEKYGSNKLGLAKNGDLLIFGVFGLLYKFKSNSELTKTVTLLNNDYKSNCETIKQLITQNDIGNLNFFDGKFIEDIKKNTFNIYFEYLFTNILVPAYKKFNNRYPSYSYGNFVKSDLYYYTFVIPEIIDNLKFIDNYLNLDEIFDLSDESTAVMKIVKDDNYDNLNLEQSLLKFRDNLFKNNKGKNNETLSLSSIAKIRAIMPKSIDKLKDCYLTNTFCAKYGQQILDIINKKSK